MSSGWKKLLKHDIKEYLSQIIEQKKKKNPRFSQRAFAQQIGLTSTTLNEILKGKRKISPKTIAKLKAAFSENEELLQLLDDQTSAVFSTFHIESKAMTETASNWFYLAILELMQTEDFNEDPAWIAKRLGIQVESVEKALADLLKIEAIRRSQFNKLTPAHNNNIKFADDDSREAIIKTHDELLEIIKGSVRKLPLDDVSSGYMLVATSQEDRDYIHSKSISFVNECAEYLGRANAPKKEVYLLNVSFVPLTKKELSSELEKHVKS
ncbi:DUF4423 domain-containing protein [Bdellovibrio bacteriovorus]|uniref:DUF4423 domain-containing protein n=1 Tax=Bdellovibrio bacteriovorus TaxID=959 RepID=UPI0035A6CCCE